MGHCKAALPLAPDWGRTCAGLFQLKHIRSPTHPVLQTVTHTAPFLLPLLKQQNETTSEADMAQAAVTLLLLLLLSLGQEQLLKCIGK